MGEATTFPALSDTINTLFSDEITLCTYNLHQRFLAGLFNCQNRLNLSIFLLATCLPLKSASPPQRNWPRWRVYWQKLGTVQEKPSVVHCEHTASAGFVHQRMEL